MAFTPHGMFYLSQEDLQPSMDAIGTGFRGMLGIQNKEEAVNSILQGADYDTPEGRRTALEKIRAIDPEAYYKYSKMNKEYETKTTSRKTIKGADDYQYFQDTGERVLPDVVAKTSSSGTALNQADKIIFSDMKAEFGDLEGANQFAKYKQSQKESEARAGTDIGTVKPSDVAKISNDWRAETGSIRESIATIDNAKTLIDQAAAGNATAYKQVNRFLIKVVGDSQISKAEVDDMLSAGSLPERLSQTLTMWASGKPTKTKAEDIRTILNALNQLNKKRVNKTRKRLRSAYGTTYLPEASYSAILGDDYDLGTNAADATMNDIDAAIAAKTGAK